MAAPDKPIELYFREPIYARGEDIAGKNAFTDDGKVNMIRVARGEVVIFRPVPARDLLISKQAIDNRNASTTDKADARSYVEERNRVENPEPKRKAA